MVRCATIPIHGDLGPSAPSDHRLSTRANPLLMALHDSVNATMTPDRGPTNCFRRSQRWPLLWAQTDHPNIPIYSGVATTTSTD
jgi:hypothetical protein